jgi:hypothetical protein
MTLAKVLLSAVAPKSRGSTTEWPEDRATGSEYMPEDAIAQQYRFADRISNQNWAPTWAGVLAAGLGGAGGGMHRTSAQNALKGNQGLMSQMLRRAGSAKTAEEATSALMESGVPSLEKAGVENRLKSLEPTKPTDDMREYEYAQQKGFKGSFTDFKMLGRKDQTAQAPTISEIYDSDGRAQKVWWNPATSKYEPIGGSKSNPLDSALGRAQATADVKRVKEYQDSSDGAEELRGNLAELRSARDAATKAGTWRGPAYSALPNWSDEAQRVTSSAENVRLGFVNKTKGAVSDAEMKIFGNATPGIDMSDEAATPIIDGMDLAAQRTQERGLFFDTWLRTHKSLDGAGEAWKRYVDQNPIIRQDEKGGFVLAPENVGNWRQKTPELAGAGQRAASGPANVPEDAVRELVADPSPEARQEFDEVFGSGAADSVLEGQ